MKIEVTREHIENAVIKDSHHCMIADAIKQQVLGAQYISVDIQTIRFTDPTLKERYIYLTPRDAQWGIIRFDRGVRNIQPFEFHLRAPSVRKMGQGKKKGKGARKKYAGTGKKRTVVVRKEREFGIRMYDTKTIQSTKYPNLVK